MVTPWITIEHQELYALTRVISTVQHSMREALKQAPLIILLEPPKIFGGVISPRPYNLYNGLPTEEHP